MAITAFLSHSPGLLNRVPGGPASLGHGPHSSIFPPTNSNFLCTELYHYFTPTQFNLSTLKVTPLIPSTGGTSYLHRSISYFDSSARVNMQQRVLLQFHRCLWLNRHHDSEYTPVLNISPTERDCNMGIAKMWTSIMQLPPIVNIIE